MAEGQNKNIDTQAQDLKNLDLNDIKKLFDKIPKEYLDTLDIDKDKDFDEQDIQKIISGDIDPNSILGKEIKAKQEALSIKLLKEIIDSIENRITKRKNQILHSSKIKEIGELNLKVSNNKINKIKNNKITLDNKQADPNINLISNNIETKTENINNLKEKLKGKNGLFEQLNTQINVINELVNFIDKNNETLSDKDYDFLYKNLKETINKSIKLISQINQTFTKISNEEKEKKELVKKYEELIIKLQDDTFKLIEESEKNNKDKSQSKTKKLFYQKVLHKLKYVGSTIKEYSNTDFSIAKSKIIKKINKSEEKIELILKQASSRIKEAKIGIEEFVDTKKAINEKYQLLPNNSQISDLKLLADNIQKSNKIDQKTKKEKLKEISNKMSNIIKSVILNNAESNYDKIISIFPDNNGYIKTYLNSIYKFGKAIEDHNGVSSYELEQLKEMGKFLGELNSKALEIEKIYAQTAKSGKELEEIIEKGKPLLTKILTKIFSGDKNKKIDLSEFKKFIKDNTDTNFLNKKIEEMDANDAEKALLYLNSKYNENKSSWGFDFSDESSINELKDKKDINIFQERLIEKIIKEKGGKIDREAGYGFTNDGFLWGFNKKNGGNYLISMVDAMAGLQDKDVDEFNSKEFASFIIYLDNFSETKEGVVETLKYTLGIKKLEKLQKYWNNPNFPHIAKNIIEKINLNTIIKLIKTFKPENYNNELNTKVENEKMLENKLKIIEERINGIQDKTTRDEAINLALKKLKIKNPKIFDNIDFTKLKTFTTNPDIIKIYKNVIWEPTEKLRKKERKQGLTKAKNNFKKTLQKMFGEKFNGLQPIYQIIDYTNITAENGDKQIEVMYNIIKSKIQEHNKLHPNNKIDIDEGKIINILKIANKIKLHQLEQRQTELFELMESLNQQIESLTKEKQKIEEEKIKVTESIEENNKQIKILEKKLKTTTDNEEKRKLEKQIKILKEKNKELIKKKEELEKQIKLKSSQIQSSELNLHSTGEDAIENQEYIAKVSLEQVVLEIAQKYKISIEEARKTDEYKKKKEEIDKKTKKTKKKIEAIQNAKTPEERSAIIEDLIKENQEKLMKSDYKKDIEELNNSIKKFSNTIESNKIDTYANNLDITSFSSKGENNYTIKVNGEEIDGLTQEEIKDIGIKKDKDGNIIVENPDILENTINFYKFFKDLNLLGVWKYRKELTKSMGDININLEDDSLKKRELVKFGNKLIHFINNLPKNEKNKDIQLNENLDELSKIETELRKFSQANSMLSSGKTFNNLGEDILTANLRDLGIIGGACFHTMQFRDIMNGNINSN